MSMGCESLLNEGCLLIHQPRYKSVAVIGAGPSGISAVKALQEEKIFQTIRLFPAPITATLL
jgi:NADPH-dependent glutamate synthase beta subunit-like oxidoreductase